MPLFIALEDAVYISYVLRSTSTSNGAYNPSPNFNLPQVRDTTFNGAVQAIRIKADPGSSGHVHDVLYDNIEVTDSDMTILLTLVS